MPTELAARGTKVGVERVVIAHDEIAIMHQRLVHKSAPYVIPPGTTAQSPVYFRVRSHSQYPCVYGWHGCIWIFLLSVGPGHGYW